MSKKIIFIADSLDSAQRFQQILSHFDADIVAGSSLMGKKLINENPDANLLIIEVGSGASALLSDLASNVIENGNAAILAVVPISQIPELRLPLKVSADFVSTNASPEECLARIKMLLSPGSETSSSDFVKLGNMTMNLATYQVKVNEEPLDLTYLEYALLSFLVTHPGRTYSRDTLLKRVWGFDYYGGSRTVDVHVRRIRAKLGPELAQHLETVRGVGYLWNV